MGHVDVRVEVPVDDGPRQIFCRVYDSNRWVIDQEKTTAPIRDARRFVRVWRREAEQLEDIAQYLPNVAFQYAQAALESTYGDPDEWLVSNQTGRVIEGRVY